MSDTGRPIPPGPLLPKGRLTGPMPWIIAIMMFLTVLASAAGLALNAAARSLSAQVSDRITVQIAEADGEIRDRAVRRITALLAATDGIANIAVIPQNELAAQLAPWLGTDMKISEIPVPAMVDADFNVPQGERATRLAALDKAVKAASGAAKVEPHARYLEPLARLVGGIGLLAFSLVALMALATGAVVVLAARGAHATHRGTIDIMHLLGATDAQVVGLFERRMILDTLFGAAIGTGTALAVVLGVSEAMRSVTSDLVRSATLPGAAWIILLLLPAGCVGLSWLSARITLHRALEHSL